MKRAIFTVTENGIKLGLEINHKLKSEIYSLEKYCGLYPVHAIIGSLKDFMQKAFYEYDEIIMIMSCGIAVRTISPYLESKLKDPAVVVCDETGRFAISLLSGHIGGANRLAEAVAQAIGGMAVITTASDNQGLEAVDTLAERLGLAIDSFEAAKRVTAVMVNGGKVGLCAVQEYKDIICNGAVKVAPDDLNKVSLDALIYIGYNDQFNNEQQSIPVVRLVPKQLVLGIGCRKDTDEQKISDAVKEFLTLNHMPIAAISKIATVDIKQNEPGIIRLVKELGAELIIIAAEQIREIEHLFETSDFVKKSVGVGCVCEPSAYLASGHGECLVHKSKCDGITLCLYRELA